MTKRHNIQDLFILREYRKAIQIGAFAYARRIRDANPQIQPTEWGKEVC